MEGRPNLAGLLSGSPGSCLSSWEPWELSVIPSQHRRMSGTRQKEPGSTEGCQGAQKDVREHRRMSEGASELPILLYICYTACEISQFYRVCDFSPFYSFCEISPVFLSETSKNTNFVKKHENFSRKTKIFPLFLASFKNSLYLCTVKS